MRNDRLSNFFLAILLLLMVDTVGSSVFDAKLRLTLTVVGEHDPFVLVESRLQINDLSKIRDTDIFALSIGDRILDFLEWDKLSMHTSTL